MGLFNILRKRKQERREFIKDLQENEKEIRKQKIKSRENILKTILKQQKDNPCIQQTYNVEKISEFVSDDNKNWGVKRIIAIWVTLGYLLTNLMIFGLGLFPFSFLFRSYLIFCFVSVLVILSYFYSSLKMGNLFKGLFM